MSGDWLLRPGVILFVEDVRRSVAFYQNVLELGVIHDQGDVVILEFGAAYLMIEPVSYGEPGKSASVLRFNVADVEATAELLRGRGAHVEVSNHPWGTVGRLRDPDGNRCELRNHYDGHFAPVR